MKGLVKIWKRQLFISIRAAAGRVLQFDQAAYRAKIAEQL
jgi:hypothetical protein